MILANFIYPSAATANSMASIKGGGDLPTQKLIDDALNTAINAGLFTCTASMTGKSSQDIQNNMNALKALGYVVSLSGTTLTITYS